MKKKLFRTHAFITGIVLIYTLSLHDALPISEERREGKECMLSVLNEYKNDHIILISTGLLDIAHRISKDVLVLNNGELNPISHETMQIPEIKEAVLDILGEADNEII